MKALDAADIRHDIAIRTGSVAGEIVELVNKGRFEMIVLGSKGRGAMLNLLIGSVPQRVLATATQPVTLVKKAQPRRGVTPTAPEKAVRAAV